MGAHGSCGFKVSSFERLPQNQHLVDGHEHGHCRLLRRAAGGLVAEAENAPAGVIALCRYPHPLIGALCFRPAADRRAIVGLRPQCDISAAPSYTHLRIRA